MDDDEWEEVQEPASTSVVKILAAPSTQREAWMEESNVHDLFKSNSREKKNNVVERERIEKEKLIISRERELPLVQNEMKYTFGDKGSTWRMMKLERVYELAKQDGISVQEAALERYRDFEEFETAVKERKYLDENSARDRPQLERGKSSSFRVPLKKSSFKAPGAKKRELPSDKDHGKYQDQEKPKMKTVTKLVAVKPVLTTDELNKLYSKVIKARIMKSANLEELQDEYGYQKRRSETHKDVIIIKHDQDDESKGKELKRPRTDTHDKDGNRTQYLDESQQSLDDLVRAEKLKMSDSSYDREIAQQISKDGRYVDNLDYVDEASEQLSRGKRNPVENQRLGYLKDQKKFNAAIQSCRLCQQEGRPPEVTIIALGMQTYLALPETIDMVPYHCMIVPLSHATCSLELDDEVWDEIRNFKKCLIRMFEKLNMGVLFMEQVVNIKKKAHTVIECIPVPRSVYEDASGYFKEALLTIEGEWTQHKPIIVTDKGFRKSMVKNLPYFHIWFDPNRGYGHVIEDSREWPVWFGKEIIASALDLPPELWRRPKMIDSKDAAERSRFFVKAWDDFDWTKMLG